MKKTKSSTRNVVDLLQTLMELGQTCKLCFARQTFEGLQARLWERQTLSRISSLGRGHSAS